MRYYSKQYRLISQWCDSRVESHGWLSYLIVIIEPTKVLLFSNNYTKIKSFTKGKTHKNGEPYLLIISQGKFFQQYIILEWAAECYLKTDLPGTLLGILMANMIHTTQILQVESRCEDSWQDWDNPNERVGGGWGCYLAGTKFSKDELGNQRLHRNIHVSQWKNVLYV